MVAIRWRERPKIGRPTGHGTGQRSGGIRPTLKKGVSHMIGREVEVVTVVDGEAVEEAERVAARVVSP